MLVREISSWVGSTLLTFGVSLDERFGCPPPSRYNNCDGPGLQDINICIKTAVQLAKYTKFQHFLHCACNFRDKYT